MKPTAIVTFHTNPYTCGVARFNIALAESLDVPLVTLSDFLSKPISGALLSIKCEEIGEENSGKLSRFLVTSSEKFDVYLHGWDNSDAEEIVITQAARIFTATMEMADAIRNSRNDVQSTFAPGANPSPVMKQVDCTLLTFGMAHKIRSDGYQKLGEILTADERSVQLEISTALHDGTSFSEDFFSVGSEISEVFNGNVSFLGFLADDEVSRRLRAADALVAFFPSGVRENNTTVLSAMAHGCAVITNLDSLSPSWMKHNDSVFDISQLNTFPTNAELTRVGIAARAAVNPYSFESLATLLTDTTEQ